MRSISSDAKIAALIVLAVAIVFSDVLFFGSGFYVRDVYRDYLPSHFVLRTVLAQGEFPLWNRFYSGGQPLAANPGFQTFYPGTWLAFLPGFIFGFNLEIVAHIALAAIGMFLFLRSLDLKVDSALFGAVAFALGGVVMSLTNLLPFLTSVGWWPLIVMFARRVVRGEGGWAGLAISLGMLFLAAEQSMMVQTAILLGGAAAAFWQPAGGLKPAAPLLGACLLALGIGAVQLVPALDLKRDSGRAQDLSYEDATAWSMPLVRPAELFYPHAFGRITDDALDYGGTSRYRPPRLPLIFSIYCGLLVPLLAIGGVVMRVSQWMWAVTLVLFSYVLAIGGNGPLIPLLYWMGIYRTMRYPEKFILFGLFALIVLAAMAFDRLDRRLTPFLLLFTVGDLALHVNELAPRMPRRFFNAPPVTLALRAARGPARLFHEAEWPVWKTPMPIASGSRTYWSQRTALLPFTPALYGLQSIFEIDINLTTLRPTADFLQSLWEAYGAGAPLRPFLLMGNVEYVIVPGAPIRIIRTPTLPRVFFADQLVQIGRREDFVRAMTTMRWSDRVAFVDFKPFAPARGEVLSASESANAAAMRVRSDGQSFLVIGTTPHRYWRATIDGRPAPLRTANLGFQGMVVPPGPHTIELRYRSPLILICGMVSMVSTIIAAAACFRKA